MISSSVLIGMVYDNCVLWVTFLLFDIFGSGIARISSACQAQQPCNTSPNKSNCGFWGMFTVGIFPELKHTQFTWFGNLPTPRSYWFVLMKLTNNTTKEEENLLNSTLHSSSLYSSLFSRLSVFSISATSLCSLDTHTKNFTGGAH